MKQFILLITLSILVLISSVVKAEDINKVKLFNVIPTLEEQGYISHVSTDGNSNPSAATHNYVFPKLLELDTNLPCKYTDCKEYCLEKINIYNISIADANMIDYCYIQVILYFKASTNSYEHLVFDVAKFGNEEVYKEELQLVLEHLNYKEK